jgi:hypothetical protein
VKTFYVCIVIWLGCGVYGMLANMERIPRVWGRTHPGDGFQHFLTGVLGPIGILCVMTAGGRWDFWRSPDWKWL